MSLRPRWTALVRVLFMALLALVLTACEGCRLRGLPIVRAVGREVAAR